MMTGERGVESDDWAMGMGEPDRGSWESGGEDGVGVGVGAGAAIAATAAERATVALAVATTGDGAGEVRIGAMRLPPVMEGLTTASGVTPPFPVV